MTTAGQSSTPSAAGSTGLRLRIPEPARGHGPADRVRFVSKAGEMKKPALDEKIERVALMRKQLLRVLDDDGTAIGEWVPELSPTDQITGLRNMMLVRSFDARLLRAHRQGRISFYMQSLGEEAIACAQQQALRPGDMHFPTYRQQGLLISSGYPIVEMMNQVLSNDARPAQGPAAAGPLFVEVARLLLDLGQPRHSVHPGRRLGDGVGFARWHRDRVGLDRRGLNGRVRLSRRTVVRVDLSGARDPEHRQQPLGDLHARRLRAWRVGDVRRPRVRVQHPRVARRRQRLPRGLRGVVLGRRARHAATSVRR